ncbi:MAG TPA: hypothetical protein VGK73_39700 [Polyangiaceae bacterium]
MKKVVNNRKSWGVAVLTGAALALLGASCALEQAPAESGPAVEDFDLSSVPTDMASLEAALVEYSKAYDVNHEHPAVRARRAQLDAVGNQLSNLVETLEIEPGHSVVFYEPQPGLRVIGERSLDAQRRVLAGVALSSFENVYRALRPSAQPPVALLEADRRAGDPMLASAAPPVLDTAPEVDALPAGQAVDKHATSSCTHFTSSHGGCPPGSSGDTPFCFCNNVGVARAFSHTAAHSAWLVGTYAGNVSIKLSYNGGVVLIDAVDAGEIWGLQLISGSGNGTRASCNGCGWSASCNFYSECLRDHRGDVIAVEAGDSYHFGGCTENDQSVQGDAWECI